MENLKEIGQKVKETVAFLNKVSTKQKNEALKIVAEELINNQKQIIQENQRDIENAKEKGMKASLIDRLQLNEKRIEQMAEGLRKVADLQDPVGETIEGKVLENGLEILKKRVPLGVIAIIYESRPNVTADAFGLCFKTGNAVILRGGADAIHSNTAIVSVIKKALDTCGIPQDVIALVEDTSRETAKQLMKLNEYVDVLIPRGGAGLIKTVVENSTVPVIETGTGNCHVYVDKQADIDMALAIIENAKTQRTGVCNACESVVIHKQIAQEFIPYLVERLAKSNVEIRGDQVVQNICPQVILAKEEDWATEYLDLILSVKIVDNLTDAIKHINKHSTKHSETIVTKDYEAAREFLNQIDSAAVYVNASTRFTDGAEFGFGAEIGISTQKLHARGPMGLKELTTTKYIIYGNGQIRK